MLSEYQLTLNPITLDNANPEAQAVLEKAQAQVGFIPNMYARMVHSPGLLTTYLDGYERFRQQSGFTPAEQEVVFLTISRENGCEYCMGAHSVIADNMSKVPTAVTDALREGAPLPDAKLAALSVFTQVMVRQRGLPSRAQVADFLSAGYTERQMLEIVLAIAVKTLSNYANHLFHTPLDSVFAARAWKD
ncbi:MAG: carboxymuconolactone decarboxylase family protein [Candidatus Competibacteraceae bacterium]|nr:carboxymuconolactone decarboxylase family protein [Candidatus Competibacteraceae bacterium]MCB1771104.1 carboxymuconolactone decarboxylase family protein [Candidatus Competibacteraceae bacterium]MCB1820199.1 carboxymuconolactone decarboxylase family protein [Candidatus Competibacteraceae bacterium]MCB1921716.1 carboxymuconolactone decarboxylase family protein [Candidatus Competibacteraceae bacterium]